VKPENKPEKTRADKPAEGAPPAPNEVSEEIVPPLPLWKQRTMVRPRFTIP